MIERNAFKNAMSLLSSAVSIVTTQGATGQFGFTASAVCSVTDDPPSLLVCMNRSASSHGHFVENKVLAVNVLAAHQQAIAQAFSSKLSPSQRFSHGSWQTLLTGSPILSDALVSLDCAIEQMQVVGTHTIFICKVLDVRHHEQTQSLVYFNRQFFAVGQSHATKPTEPNKSTESASYPQLS